MSNHHDELTSDHQNHSTNHDDDYNKEIINNEIDNEYITESINDLSCESKKEISIEKKKELINLYEPGCKIYKIAKAVGLNYDVAKQIVDEYMQNPRDYFYVPPVKKEIRYIGKDGNEHYIELSDIRKDLATKEETLEAQNKCLQEYCDYLIEDGADKDYVYNFFKTELNYTPEGGDKDLSDTADVSCDNVCQINNFCEEKLKIQVDKHKNESEYDSDEGNKKIKSAFNGVYDKLISEQSSGKHKKKTNGISRFLDNPLF